MLVRERMSRKVIAIAPERAFTAARALMQQHNIRQLPVVRQQRLLGMVTDRDLRSAPATAKTVADIMTAEPVCVGADTAVDEAARVLRRHKIGALPVLENSRLIGILTGSDVLDAFVDLSGVAECTYHLMLTAPSSAHVRRRIRQVIEQEHGELKWLHCGRKNGPANVHLRLKARRIDEIVTSLEAVGFDVCSVVAPAPRRP